MTNLPLKLGSPPHTGRGFSTISKDKDMDGDKKKFLQSGDGVASSYLPILYLVLKYHTTTKTIFRDIF